MPEIERIQLRAKGSSLTTLVAGSDIAIAQQAAIPSTPFPANRTSIASVVNMQFPTRIQFFCPKAGAGTRRTQCAVMPGAYANRTQCAFLKTRTHISLLCKKPWSLVVMMIDVSQQITRKKV